MASPKPRAILYRILGNDLPPRYSPGQTLANLRFTLEHEEELLGLEKRWLLNRIVSLEMERDLQHTIAEASQRCDVIPFRAEDYQQAWTDLGTLPPDFHPWSEAFQGLSAVEQAFVADYIGRAKNLYLMNNNGARNHALELGFRDAEWVLPWDGGCFLPAWAWAELQTAMQRPELSYLVTPMHRLRDQTRMPDAHDSGQLELVEPQLGFARHAALRFDPGLRYGSGPKWQALQRIGLPGPWQHTPGWLPWEDVDTSAAPDQGRWAEAGVVLRLSGESRDQRYVDEQALWHLRFASIRRFTRRVDCDELQKLLPRHRFRCWLRLAEPTFPARDRAFAAQMASKAAQLDSLLPVPGSDAWVKPPWAAICWLTLDAKLNGAQPSQARAVELVRAWCLQPDRAWDPSGQPLQRAEQLGALHPLLDAFTLLREQDAFSDQHWQQLQAWCSCVLAWLTTEADVFLREQQARPSSTWQHLLILALAAFLDRPELCCQVIDNLPGLLCSQYRPDGHPQGTEAKIMTVDEQLSNLQAWLQLAQLCSCLGRDLLAHRTSTGQGLQQVLAWAQNNRALLREHHHDLQRLDLCQALTSAMDRQDDLNEVPADLLPGWWLCRVIRS